MTATLPCSWPPGDRDAACFFARAFADAPEDLDIAFGSTPRPILVTRLLALCLRRVDESVLSSDSAWALTVSERLQGLLAIVHAGGERMTQAVASCGHAGCGGRVELELGLEGFASVPVAALRWQAPDGRGVQLRLPNGLDLAAWPQQSNTAMDAEAWLARSLVERIDDESPAEDWRLPTGWLEPLSAALADADPLTALTLDVTCPYCERIVAVDVDLELLLIDTLRQRQARLLDEVHQVAAHYHWSEQDIAALPSWRRRRYIARLQAELA